MDRSVPSCTVLYRAVLCLDAAPTDRRVEHYEQTVSHQVIRADVSQGRQIHSAEYPREADIDLLRLPVMSRRLSNNLERHFRLAGSTW